MRLAMHLTNNLLEPKLKVKSKEKENEPKLKLNTHFNPIRSVQDLKIIDLPTKSHGLPCTTLAHSFC